MHNFYINKQWLSRYGGYIIQTPRHEIAQRSREAIELPGVNGNIILDNKCYSNVEFERVISFIPFINRITAKELAYAIIDWLTSETQYSIYRDTYNPGYFTYAYISESTQIERELPSLLTTTVKLSRKPYWYNEVGAREITLNVGTNKIINPENYYSEPILRLTQNKINSAPLKAVLLINGEEVILKSSHFSYKTVIMDAQKKQYWETDGDSLRLTQHISEALPPNLKTGVNTIEVVSISSNSNITITPNWRRL